MPARYVAFNYVDTGLRGRKFTYAASDTDYDFTLKKGLKWTEDVAVSGTMSWDQTSNIITAQVTLKGAANRSALCRFAGMTLTSTPGPR